MIDIYPPFVGLPVGVVGSADDEVAVAVTIHIARKGDRKGVPVTRQIGIYATIDHAGKYRVNDYRIAKPGVVNKEQYLTFFHRDRSGPFTAGRVNNFERSVAGDIFVAARQHRAAVLRADRTVRNGKPDNERTVTDRFFRDIPALFHSRFTVIVPFYDAVTNEFGAYQTLADRPDPGGVEAFARRDRRGVELPHRPVTTDKGRSDLYRRETVAVHTRLHRHHAVFSGMKAQVLGAVGRMPALSLFGESVLFLCDARLDGGQIGLRRGHTTVQRGDLRIGHRFFLTATSGKEEREEQHTQHRITTHDGPPRLIWNKKT